MVTAVPKNGTVIYSIFVRQYGPKGKFSEVTEDLDRIVELGVSHIWLLPIHPIGETNRKGTVGSPYAIKDYRTVDPHYGTLFDFRELIAEAHARDLGVLMDCVYNHTSPDSAMATSHPEWFHQDAKGQLMTRFPEWSDVVDIKYFNAKKEKNVELWDYLIDNLIFWAKLGVDGYRCDVAPFVPLEFWLEARARIADAVPDRKLLWIAESVDPAFVRSSRRRGITTSSETLLFKAFDICYQYNFFKIYQNCIREREDVELLFEMLRYEEAVSEMGFCRLRFVDNHDNPRVNHITRSNKCAQAWLCLTAFLKGALLIYQGCESAEVKQNSLFEKEPVEWGDYSNARLIQDICALKNLVPVLNGHALYLSGAPFACVARSLGSEVLIGVFDIYGLGGGEQEVPVPDGTYENLIGGGEVNVEDGCVMINGLPFSAAVFRYKGVCEFEELRSRFE